MIKDELVLTKICANRFEKWKSLGYVLPDARDIPKGGIEVYVNPHDLDKNSNVYVNCVCESCGKDFKNRKSRNTIFCFKCNRSNITKSNKNFVRKATYEIPVDFEEVAKHKGKVDLSKHYSVSIPVVNRWIRESGVEIPSKLNKLSTKQEIELKTYIENIPLENRNVNYICQMTGHENHYIRQFVKRHDIKINNYFENQSCLFENVVSNLSLYVELNKNGKTLLEISKDYNISIEHLKRAFRENNIDVVLHTSYKSKGETEVKQHIYDLGFECVTIRKDRYEIDCFIPEKQFGIEYCGEYWHSNDKNRHEEKRSYYAETHGIKLMTIFEHEWLTKNDIVKSMISSRLGISKRIFARKTKIVLLSSNEAKTFHNNNHINGYVNSSVNIGLEYDGEIISVLSLVKSRFSKDYEWEISRFSSKLGMNVVGGLGKLFKYFVDSYNPVSMMTYADLRFGEGKAYEKIGMTYFGKTPPNYFYFKPSNVVNTFEPRQKYQKSKLKHMNSYSEDKTEYQIMEDEGFLRIWDCGSNKYEWKRGL